ncbi:hypothetical protein [Altererythrobacter sp.]|uniref:hypothetical protein n=1 Tax=Altererythrobacter sp. TaxID=1872480 RepID=UPI003D10C7AF
MPVAALALVAIWALAEALLFFIVADVPIMAVGIRFGWRKGVAAACIAAVCAGLGGLIVTQWAAADPAGAQAAIEQVPAISRTLMEQAAIDYSAGGWRAMLAGSFAGTPYKLYALAAGITGDNPAGFFLASIVARLPRFLLVGIGGGFLGPRLREKWSARRVWLLFTCAWALFYAVYFAAMPG